MKSAIHDLLDCGRYGGQAGAAGNRGGADNEMIEDGRDKNGEIEEDGIRRKSAATGQGGDRAEATASPSIVAEGIRDEAAVIGEDGFRRNPTAIEDVASRTASPAFETHGLRNKKAACSVAAIHASGQCEEDAVSAAPAAPLFWSFPAGRGVRQPWRSRLWEHRRNQL